MPHRSVIGKVDCKNRQASNSVLAEVSNASTEYRYALELIRIKVQNGAKSLHNLVNIELMTGNRQETLECN